MPGLKISYSGMERSSQVNFNTGHVTAKMTYNFTLTPGRVGEYTIPPLTANVGGQRLTTQPLKLTVLKPSTPLPASVNSGAQPAFLRLVVPKKHLYIGEVVPAEMQLYLNHAVQNVDRFQLASVPADGFNVGKMVSGGRQQVRVGNAVYTMVSWRFTLTPVKTGPLTVGPLQANIVLELPSKNQRSDPFFDPFGMFNNNQRKQLPLTTKTSNVQSLPLPTQHAPPDFNGAVGDYTMAVTAGPTNVAVGDPITVRVRISGRGALDALSLPKQSSWHDFQTYPPTSKVKTTDQLGIQGTKSFEVVVSPQSAEIKALPAFSFSFFDPNRGEYRTLTHPAIPLTVRPGGSTPTPTIAAANQNSSNNPPPSNDIVYIKQRLGAVAQIGPPLARQSWFLALQSVPVLALLCSVVWRKRSEHLANNPRLRRQRQVAQIIRDGLSQLRRAAAENNSDAFFATLFRLLQEQLGERLDLPASAITEAVVEEHLEPRHAPEEVVAGVRDLFHACNLARYAPIKSSQELAAFTQKLEGVLRALQGLKL